MTHNYQSASMMKRIIAFLIDGILMGGLLCCLLFVYMGGKTIPPNSDEGKVSIADKYEFFSYAEAVVFDSNRTTYIKRFVVNYPIGFLMILLLPFLYGSVFEGMGGATIGKYIVGIRVRRKDLGKISFMTACVRNAGKIISKAIVFIGCILALFDKKSQALHDKIANTLVVNK